MSADINYRQRRYLISMGIRTVCFLLAVILAGRAPAWLVGIMIVAALVLPYISVVFANGGREPENAPRFDAPGENRQSTTRAATQAETDPQGTDRKPVSGHSPEIGS
jgi:hypothetical protein